jgi:hypothetical protein
MSQALGYAVLAGVISGGLSVTMLTGMSGFVLLAYFVQLPLVFIGLSMGLAASLIAVIAASLVSGLFAGLLGTVIYLVVQAAPALVVVRQALLSREAEDGSRLWYPAGLILAILTALAAGAIMAAHVAFMGQPGGLQGAVEAFLAEALAALVAASGQSATAVPPVNGWAGLFPALIATSWLVMAIVNAVLGQALSVKFGWNRRPSPDLASLELPSWLWPAMGLAAAIGFLGGEQLGFLGSSILVVLIVPFAFLGLAVIHKFAARWPQRRLGLTAIYIGIIAFGWPIIAVTALGMVEDWARLRRYM